jgi:hypothetical protein
METLVVPLLRNDNAKHLDYLVFPSDDGPAALVWHSASQKGSGFNISSGEHSIRGYHRVPEPGQTYENWKKATGATAAGDVGRKSRPFEEGELWAQFREVTIEPPLQDPEHIKRAAGVVATQFLRNQSNPRASNTIVDDLVAAGVPFDTVHTEIIVHRHRAE